MREVKSGRIRRVFCWPEEARQLARDYQDRMGKAQGSGEAGRRILVTKLVQISGNPRDACLRFLRQLGVTQRRNYREWTKAEQQRLLDLTASLPVEEAARIMRRPPGSVRSMLHRLEGGGRRGREWFTKTSLAAALHISPDEVQKWMDRGWLRCRLVPASGLKRQIIDPDDFCEFFKQYGRQAAGRRLTYEGLLFVRNYVFPSSHAELLSLRESYKKRDANSAEPESGHASEEDIEEDTSDRRAQDSSEVA
jgi:hypothetical protein